MIIVNFLDKILIFDEETIMLKNVFHGHITNVDMDPYDGSRFLYVSKYRHIKNSYALFFKSACENPEEILLDSIVDGMI
jgi:hypothetical protein